jgi:endonuclease-8/formamidopyrimidine-DNA glycosylase
MNMPEGHTLHRLARSLTKTFADQRVRTSSPQGRFESGAQFLDGSVLTRADAVGKHLLVSFDSPLRLHVHLGLYGTFVARRLPEPDPVGALRLRIVGDESYADLRGPTACELLDDDQVSALMNRIGPDPLHGKADPNRAWTRISKSKAPVGALLMDQSVIGGAGNIYRAEVLYRQGISPFREGRSLAPEQFHEIWDDLVILMKDGVKRGRIVTVDKGDMRVMADLDSDRRAPDDAELDGGEDTPARRRARRATGVYVYQRTGRPCLRCGVAIAAQEFYGRNLFWCPGCQK